MAQIVPIHAKIPLGSNLYTGIWVTYLFFSYKMKSIHFMLDFYQLF